MRLGVVRRLHFPETFDLEARVRDQTKAALRASLGKDAYVALHAEGRALTLEDALTLALRPD